MKTVLLHGLGQTAQDWEDVVRQLSTTHVECPELFSSTGNEISYTRILAELERQYSNETESLRICGLSLGALLALDFAIRHGDSVPHRLPKKPPYLQYLPARQSNRREWLLRYRPHVLLLLPKTDREHSRYSSESHQGQ